MVVALVPTPRMDMPTVTELPSIDGDRFRQAMRRLANGVCVITTADRFGIKLGLTATSVVSASLDPPLVLVCIDNRSRTIPPLQARIPFVVHFLASDQEELARRFAGSARDKFAGLAYHPTPRGCPRLEGVLASLECVVHRLFPAGDHAVVVGRVVDTQVSGDGSPLLYFAGRYVS